MELSERREVDEQARDVEKEHGKDTGRIGTGRNEDRKRETKRESR